MEAWEMRAKCGRKLVGSAELVTNRIKHSHYNHFENINLQARNDSKFQI